MGKSRRDHTMGLYRRSLSEKHESGDGTRRITRADRIWGNLREAARAPNILRRAIPWRTISQNVLEFSVLM